VTNLWARFLASSKPSAINIFSQINSRSGTTTVIGLKSAFNPSGNSALPKYPGFIVMKTPQVGSKDISLPPGNINDFLAYLMASVTALN